MVGWLLVGEKEGRPVATLAGRVAVVAGRVVVVAVAVAVVTLFFSLARLIVALLLMPAATQHATVGRQKRFRVAVLCSSW